MTNSVRPTIFTLESENASLRAENVKLKIDLKDVLDEVEMLEKERLTQGRAPYGSYCDVSGATPHLLNKSMQKVYNALNNFIMYSFQPGSSIHLATARVSSVFFSKFERVDFGVNHGALFTPPEQLPSLAFQEFEAFDAFITDPKDSRKEAAREPYMTRFQEFLNAMTRKIRHRKFGKILVLTSENQGRFRMLAMCVWMLHKLSLSFDDKTSAVKVIRVGCEDLFDEEFMEADNGHDVEHKLGKGAATKIEYLVLPGLWINGSVVKCHVSLVPAYRDQKHSTDEEVQLGSIAENGAELHDTDMNGMETAVAEDQLPQHASTKCNEEITHDVQLPAPLDTKHETLLSEQNVDDAITHEVLVPLDTKHGTLLEQNVNVEESEQPVSIAEARTAFSDAVGGTMTADTGKRMDIVTPLGEYPMPSVHEASTDFTPLKSTPSTHNKKTRIFNRQPKTPKMV